MLDFEIMSTPVAAGVNGINEEEVRSIVPLKVPLT